MRLIKKKTMDKMNNMQTKENKNFQIFTKKIVLFSSLEFLIIFFPLLHLFARV